MAVQINGRRRDLLSSVRSYAIIFKERRTWYTIHGIRVGRHHLQLATSRESLTWSGSWAWSALKWSRVLDVIFANTSHVVNSITIYRYCICFRLCMCLLVNCTVCPLLAIFLSVSTCILPSPWLHSSSFISISACLLQTKLPVLINTSSFFSLCTYIHTVVMRFDIFSLLCGILRRSRCVQIFLLQVELLEWAQSCTWFKNTENKRILWFGSIPLPPDWSRVQGHLQHREGQEAQPGREHRGCVGRPPALPGGPLGWSPACWKRRKYLEVLNLRQMMVAPREYYTASFFVESCPVWCSQAFILLGSGVGDV